MKIFDLHADILNDIYKHSIKGETKIFEKYHLDRFKKGNISGGIFVIWLPEKTDSGEVLDFKNSFSLFNNMLDAVEKEEKNMLDISKNIKNKSDLNFVFQEDKLYFLKGIEGLRVIENNTSLIDTLFEKGYRHCTLTWNEENNLATGTRGDKDRGTTELGKEVILKMNKLGMLVDVSHLNEKSFWDLMSITKKPVIASHSSASALCPHVRNLTDEQIKEIGKNGGVIGVNSYKTFIDPIENKRDVKRYVDHIIHIISIAGIDSVALGFDFCEYLPNADKDNMPGLNDASDSQNVINILYELGYSKDDIEKIAYKNILRVLKEVLPE